MTKDENLPCPWCGEKPIRQHHVRDESGANACAVRCRYSFTAFMGYNCPVKPAVYGRTIKEAEDRWNSRKAKP
jgi:hypothetical protein